MVATPSTRSSSPRTFSGHARRSLMSWRTFKNEVSNRHICHFTLSEMYFSVSYTSSTMMHIAYESQPCLVSQPENIFTTFHNFSCSSTRLSRFLSYTPSQMTTAIATLSSLPQTFWPIWLWRPIWGWLFFSHGQLGAPLMYKLHKHVNCNLRLTPFLCRSWKILLSGNLWPYFQVSSSLYVGFALSLGVDLKSDRQFHPDPIRYSAFRFSLSCSHSFSVRTFLPPSTLHLWLLGSLLLDCWPSQSPPVSPSNWSFQSETISPGCPAGKCTRVEWPWLRVPRLSASAMIFSIWLFVVVHYVLVTVALYDSVHAALVIDWHNSEDHDSWRRSTSQGASLLVAFDLMADIKLNPGRCRQWAKFGTVLWVLFE